MSVTSATISGVNVWQFSGAVTDTQIQTAWSALVTNGVYIIGRAIYLDSTADMTGVTGGFLVDFGTQVLPAIILSTTRDKTKSTFKNFTFLQRTGLSVTQRNSFVQLWNGSTLTNAGGGTSTDGLSMSGGGFVYGVVGNPGGADPRYLNEMPFTSLEGVTIYSQEFTEQELQIVVCSSVQLKGLIFEKCYGFPQVATPSASVGVVVYRSTQNTQSTANGGLIPIRLYPSSGRYAAVCYVDSYITRNNADITTRLIDGFGSSSTAPASFTVLNNYTRESWFGASKTTMPITSWTATNFIYGGVLKKLQFVDGANGVIKCYDSRSTTASQKCKFSETGFIDFVDTSLTPTADSTGKIALVHIGAIASGSSATIARYTDQKYTFQKFGYRVIVGVPDMTSGDNDLSAYSPVTLTTQTGISRTQAAITAATSIGNFQELLEELHVLAIGLTGDASYNAYGGGNLFTFEGGVLTTNFTTVLVDATSASKISYNSATNALTIKATALTSNSTVTKWSNPSGTMSVANGASIQGLYSSSAGDASIIEMTVLAGSSIYFGNNATGVTTVFNSNVSAGSYRAYFAPGVTTPQLCARELYGYQRWSEVITPNGTLIQSTPVYIPDVGITEPTLATVQAYTAIENGSKFYDRTAVFRLTEQGIKLGQIAARSGSNIDITGYNHKIKSTASAVYAVVGSTITTKSASYAGDTKYDTEVTDTSHTITADTTEVITMNVEDGNGDSSVDIEASGISTFELWKITNATPPDDYATGTLLATVGIGKYRFLHADGYKMVVRDTTTNFRVVESMSKGVYMAEMFFGAAVQLAQAAEVSEINVKVDLLTNNMATKPTLTDIEASTVLAMKADTDAIQTAVDTSATQVQEIAQIHGLVTGVDLVVTKSNRVAGTIEQSITETGAEGNTTVTVTRTA